MENIPETQSFHLRNEKQEIFNQFQTANPDDRTFTPVNIKTEEKHQTDNRQSSRITNVTITNEDETPSEQHQSASHSSSFHNLDSYKVPLPTTCQSQVDHQQKLLPSSAQIEQSTVGRFNKISINSLLNNDNISPFSDNNIPIHIPNLFAINQHKKRDLEPNSRTLYPCETKKPKETPLIGIGTPVEAEIVSIPTSVTIPSQIPFLPQFVPYPVQYTQPEMLTGTQVVSGPAEGLLAMAAAASELSEGSDTNAGSPGQPSSPTAPGAIQELYDELWMKHFNQLKEFKAQFGHCNVTRTKAEWKSLGNWVAEQRRKMRQGKLTQQQYEMLTTQGFEWDRSYFFKAAVPVQALYEEQNSTQHATRKGNPKKN